MIKLIDWVDIIADSDRIASAYTAKRSLYNIERD